MDNQEPTSERRKEVSMDGVVDELRNVLSGLNPNPAPATPPPAPVEPPSSFFDPTPPPPPPPAPKKNGFKDEAPPPSTNGNLASDADFWQGNVLGWPTDPNPLPPPPPVNISEPAPRPAPTPPPPPAPAPLPPTNQAMPGFSDQHFFMGTPADEPEPMRPAPSYEKPALEGEPFSLDTPFVKNSSYMDNPGMEIPEPPKSPALPPVEMAPFQFQSAIEEPKPTPPPPPPPPPLPVVKRAEELPIPIPGTITSETKTPPKKKPEEDPLGLEQNEMKPAGFLQIACFFPEGQERTGQQFVNRLKELGEKSKSHLKIEPVFVNGWPVGRADPSAWIKSSKLSGADLMFVLGPKKDLDQFKSLSSDSMHSGIRTRLVAFEQIGLRTLYADILIELERGR